MVNIIGMIIACYGPSRSATFNCNVWSEKKIRETNLGQQNCYHHWIVIVFGPRPKYLFQFAYKEETNCSKPIITIFVTTINH